MNRKETTNKNIDEKLDGLLIDVFIATSKIDKADEANLFLSGLLTKQELLFLARRLRIAILLASGYSYSTIQKSIGTSSTTIARVNEWMDIKGEGTLLAMKKLGELGQIQKILADTDKQCFGSDMEVKRISNSGKYSEIFWPIDLVAAIIKGIEKPARGE